MDDTTVDLKRRARRRLVGAIALVVFVVIVLPIVLDRQPRPISQDLTVDIPSQDTAPAFKPKLPPPADTLSATGASGDPAPLPVAPSTSSAVTAHTASQAVSNSPAATSSAASPASNSPPAASSTAPAASSTPAPASSAAPASKTTAAETKGATQSKPAASASTKTASADERESYFVPLGAFTKRENIREVQSKVSAAGFKTFSEKMPNSSQVRLRAGPFASRDAAEQARNKLKSAGVDVGKVGKT